MEFTVQEIAALTGGEVQGETSDKINTIGKIQEAGKGAISFLANPKYEKYLYTTQATAVMVGRDFEPAQTVPAVLVRVDDPYTAFSLLLSEYDRLTSLQKTGLEQPCFIDSSASVGEAAYVGAFAYIAAGAKIGKNCKIYPQVYIGENVQIGENCVLYPGVKVYRNCVIGNYCTLQAGAVIGSQGFGYAPQADGSYKTIPQVGNVVLADHVDVGANTTIDCATTGSTVVGTGVKLDNLIQIAHNVQIGKNTGIAAQAGVSGSTVVGEQCIIAGQVGVVGHLTVPDRTVIAAQSGVLNAPKNAGTTIMGSPSFDIKDHLKSYAVYKKLPDYKRKIEELEREITSIKKEKPEKDSS